MMVIMKMLRVIVFVDLDFSFIYVLWIMLYND